MITGEIKSPTRKKNAKNSRLRCANVVSLYRYDTIAIPRNTTENNCITPNSLRVSHRDDFFFLGGIYVGVKKEGVTSRSTLPAL